VCTPGNGTTASLVNVACYGIGVELNINGRHFIPNEIINYEIAPEEVMEVRVVIYYDEGYNRADGPFSVEFGALSLEYSSTVDEIIEPEMIYFNVNGIQYVAETGMTWQEFIDSDYSSGSVFISGNYVKYMVTGFDFAYLTDSIANYVFATDQIIDGGYYSYSF
jgi:hypothetical protein